jgi:hypothetical protein
MPGKMTPKIAKFLGLDKETHDNIRLPDTNDAGGYDEVKPQRKNLSVMRSK